MPSVRDMPNKAQKLWSMLGNSGGVAALGWCGLPLRDSWRSLETGQKLGTVEGLFAKLDDAQVAAETAALRSRAHP